MLIGSVVGHEINDQTHTALVQRLDQTIEILERAKARIYRAEIRNVVTEIEHGRWVERSEPNRVNAEPAEIIEALHQAR